MKQIIPATIMLSLILLSCKTNSISGIYICDQSNKKADTTNHHGTYDESTIDFTCVIEEYNFKGNSTVLIKMKNGEVVSSYIIDKEFIRIKGDKSDLLLKIKDDNTLVSEGVINGTYHKK